MTTYRRKYDMRLKPAATAKKVAKVQSDVTAIKRLVFNEEKFKDQFGTNPSVVNTGNYVVCNNLAQGDGASERTGNGVGNKRLVIRVNGQHNAAGAATMNLRVMLVRDKQPNGALPPAGTLLQNVSFQSGINDSYTARFKVLYDKTMALALNGPQNANCRISKRLKDYSKYAGNLNTIGDIQTNAYWLFFISDQVANGPQILYNIRYKYSDM